MPARISKAVFSQGQEVAIQLDLQEKTVKHHMTSIMGKLNVRNRTEAAMLLRDAGATASFESEEGGVAPIYFKALKVYCAKLPSRALSAAVARLSSTRWSGFSCWNW